jgi:hypothetical protein
MMMIMIYGKSFVVTTISLALLCPSHEEKVTVKSTERMTPRAFTAVCDFMPFDLSLRQRCVWHFPAV